jgi:acetolactate synthase small subunit
VEITGVQKSIDNFINLVSEFGVQSVSRTGVTAVERG